MDVFIEQLISVRRTGRENLKFAALIAASVILILALLFVFLMYPSPFIAVLIFIAGYLSVKLLALQSTEYEYIMTNGILDIDKIMGKSKRQRLLSINCSKVDAAGKYNPGVKVNGNYNKMFVCCNPEDTAYYIVADDKNAGKMCFVISPDKRLSQALNKYIPRTVCHNLFGGEDA